MCGYRMFHVKHSADSEKELFDEIQATLAVQQQDNYRQSEDQPQSSYGQGKAHPAELASQSVVFTLDIPEIAAAGLFFLDRCGGIAPGKIDYSVGWHWRLRHFLQTFVTKHLRFSQFFAAFHATHAVTSRKAIVFIIIHQKYCTVKRKLHYRREILAYSGGKRKVMMLTKSLIITIDSHVTM